MSDNRVSASLQTASHVLVVGAGLVYLLGYIIVSLFDATYGIADFTLFRTKVVAVGALFVVLVALAMLLTFRMFSMFGFSMPHAEFTGIPVTDKNRMFLFTDVAISMPLPCFGLMWLLQFLFNQYPTFPNRAFGSFILICALTALYGMLAKKWFDAYPFLFMFLSLTNSVALFLVLFKYFNRASFWFVLWLSAVCVFTLVISQKLREPGAARKVEWERIALPMFGIVFFLYATRVYPAIRHQFGGGSPIPIVLHLTKQMPPFESDTVSASLIDETESGYYVSPSAGNAVFVTRSLVEAVEFLHSEQTAQPSPPKSYTPPLL